MPSRKISLTHVNEAFNSEIQVDFAFVTVYRPRSNQVDDLRREKYIIIVLTDTGTSYTEAEIVSHRGISSIIQSYERQWLHRHGASQCMSADDEYHKRQLILFLKRHGIRFKARPARRHNKLGIVERKNGTLKEIIRRLAMEYSTAPMSAIVARSVFLCNMFAGSQLLSSFELAGGYQPSVLGIPHTYITQELIDAHTNQVATRALQRVLRSRTPNVPTPGMFDPGDVVWVWYATSKQNEDDRWIRAEVITTHPHYLEVRRLKNGRLCPGPTMKPAYEDVRVAPRQELARQLMECTLESALDDDSPERGVDNHASTSEDETDAPQSHVGSLMTTIQVKPKLDRKKTGVDDIGGYAENLDSNCNNIKGELLSEKHRILDDIHQQVGSRQVSRGQLAFAPPWILQDAFQQEYSSNWVDSYELIHQQDLLPNANIITFHTVYKVKTDECNKRKLKARIVPHGNRDDEKDTICKDSATTQLSVIRFLLSLTTFLGFKLATADIKGAYLQRGSIKRDIYVRPPQEWYDQDSNKRRYVWKLTKLPYEIVEAGRQWQKTVEEWMLSAGGLITAFGLSQLFLKRDEMGNIVVLVAKVTDDFLISGKLDQVQDFLDKMQRRFTVGKIIINDRFIFNGCEIHQDVVGNIRMSMTRYIERLRPISISRAKRKLRTLRASDDEMRQYRALAGTLLYLGNGVLPQAALAVSLMQQKIGNLTIQHLIDANNMLKELLVHDPWITFRVPRNTSQVSYCTFTDASHPKGRDYGQKGLIAGLRITNRTNKNTIFHVIDWTSHK